MMDTLDSNGCRIEAAHDNEDLIGELPNHLCRQSRAQKDTSLQVDRDVRHLR